MVHRPADSRLLTNLLQHEKEYSKQLAQLLDYSNASLASFAAYAAASPQPASQVILAVAGSLAAADDALRRYAASVDQWRETMTHLKDMEDEVGNVMRDREILVTRLIKASKSHKPTGQKRDSLLNSQPFASSSTLSLNGPDSPSPSRPLSLTLGSSSKLAAAQQELQACEMHLVSKEHELATRRSTAVREGLGARIKAMIECGWAWGELGKESLRNLDALIPEREHSAQRRTSSDTHTSNPNANLTRQILGIAAGGDTHSLSSLGPSQSASQTHDESQPQANIASVIEPLSLPNSQPPTSSALNPPSRPAAASRDPNELRPPSGASSVYLTPETIEDESDNDIYAPPEVQNNLPVPSATTATAITNGVPIPNPFSGTSSRPLSPESQLGDSYKNVRLPAPYAIEGYVEIPVATPDVEDKGGEKPPRRSRSSSPDKRSLGAGGGDTATPSGSVLLGSGHGGVVTPGGSGSGTSTPLFGITSQTYGQVAQQSPKRHILRGRITEEGSLDGDDRRRSLEKDITRQEEHDEVSHRHEEGHTEDSRKPEDGESTSGDDLDAAAGRLEVVENPRFMSDARRKEVDAQSQRQVEAKESSDTHTPLQSDLPDADHEVKEQPSPMPKDRKRFTFLGGHHGQSHSRTASQSSVPRTTASPPVSDVGLTFAPPGDSLLMRSAAMDTPHPVSSPLATSFPLDSRSAGTSSKTTSPSKRFLGSLRGFFGSKDKDRVHSISKGKDMQQASAIPRRDDKAEASDSDSPSEDEQTHHRSALQNLFSHRSPTKKRNGSVLSAGSAAGAGSKWETRTDRNIRELAKKGSVEGGLGSARGSQPPRGLAAEAVALAGVHLEEDEVVEARQSRRPKKKRAESVDAVAGVVNGNTTEKDVKSRRTRTASDVGVGSKDGAVGKRLKKVRNTSANGPPVAQSASWGAGVPPKKSNSTSTDASRSGPIPAAKPPAPQSSGPSTATHATKPIAPTLSLHTPASNPVPHRSATTPAPKAKVVSASTPGMALSFGRSPTASSSKPASTTAPKSADTQRSTKLDVPDNRRSFIQQHPLAIDSSDEEAEPTSVMIVDLGENRRRATSELGHGGVSPVVAVGPSTTQGVGMTRSGSGSGGAEVIKQRAAKGAFVPTPAPGVSRAAAAGVAGVTSSSIRGTPRAHDEYASDTAAFAPGAAVPTKRKKSLTKKVHTEGSSTTTALSTPSRKLSVKAAHQKPVTIANASATVLLAEGRQPSGTLVASSSGTKGGQLQVSGGLSRNSSITATSSPGAGGGGAHKRSNTLGQGMTGAIGGEVGKTGRKSSVDAAVPAITSNHAAIPVSTGPSLMNIVNGVTRGNREGWANPPSISPPTTTNGSKNPPAVIVDVKAPARVGRETLATLDPVQIRNQFVQSQSTTNKVSSASSAGGRTLSTRGTGLVDIKAPVSAFDEHYSTRQASMSSPDLVSTKYTPTRGPRTANPPMSTPRGAEVVTDKHPGPSTPARRASVTAATAAPSSNGIASTSRAPRATSKMPLKSALRNPSPVPSSQTSTSPLPGPSRHLRPTQVHAPPPPQRQSARSPAQQDIPPSIRRTAPLGTIGKGEDDSDSASTTSYETGNEVFYSDDEAQEAQHAVVQSRPAHPSILLHPNGHAEHGSELSDSTVIGSSTHQQQPQVPRRRKSVRVSLQPTYSPSPPAIEYETEEAMNRASSDRHHPQPLIAPVPVATASVTQSAVSDLWADSSEEDEDYKKAKVALRRAAKKDREVKNLANWHP